MLVKNMPLQQLAWKLPLRFALDALVAWKSLLQGNGGYFIAVLKAHYGFIYWWLFKRRLSVMPVDKKGPLQGWLNKSIVWVYFVQKKRKFSEIMGHKPV